MTKGNASKGSRSISSSTSSLDEPERKYNACEVRPYNRYNIYYILEREHFLQCDAGYRREKKALERRAAAAGAHGEGGNSAGSKLESILTGYEHLDLPDLPPRYEGLVLPHDWFSPGEYQDQRLLSLLSLIPDPTLLHLALLSAKRKITKRSHKKSHGVASFREIARVVADGWRNIDEATLVYCTAVAKIIKDRHAELKRMKGVGCFAAAAPAEAACDTTQKPNSGWNGTYGAQPAVESQEPRELQEVASIMPDFVVSPSPSKLRVSYSNGDFARGSEGIIRQQPSHECLTNLFSPLGGSLYADVPDGDILQMYLNC